MAKRKGYTYKKRTPESVRRRAEQSSYSYDRLFKENLEGFSPKEGTHHLRILPPGWADADHYGVNIWVHYSVGPDNGQYLCPDKHKDEFCPICEERRNVEDEDERRELAAKKRVLVWVIERDHEDRGPQLWSMPVSVDREIGQQACDDRTGEVLYLDDPEEGYDISFTREGTGIKTKYSGLKIGRRPCELSDDAKEMDDWLDYIEDNALPKCLNIFDGKYIEKIFAGTASSTKEVEEEEKEEEEEAVEEKPRRRSRRQNEDEVEEKEEAKSEEKEDDDQEEIRTRLRKMRRNNRREE